jgi:excinuclease UvrABC helicase subunit UvrB
MTKAQLLDEIKNLKDTDEVEFYVFDYEYEHENPYEVGGAKFVSRDGGTLYLGVHKNG